MHPAAQLVPLNAFLNDVPFTIDLVYAKDNHPDNQFSGLYDAAVDILWIHRRLAAPVLTSALLARRLGWVLEFKDCLRTVEAQEVMARFGHDERLVSRPGEGAHPRAMAIDVVVRDEASRLVEMGTPFDSFATPAALANARNPAARDFVGGWTGDDAQDAAIFANRARLEYVMRRGGYLQGEVIHPLPQEWWDFRLEESIWSALAPLHEADLADFQRLVGNEVGGWDVVNPRLPAEIVANIDRVRRQVDEARTKL